MSTVLYEDMGFDVYLYSENEQHTGFCYDVIRRATWVEPADAGRGRAYEEIVDSLQYRGIRNIVALGFSYGGGAVHNLLDRLERRFRGELEPFGENPLGVDNRFRDSFVVYVDAIVHGSPAESLRRPPPSYSLLLNIYQTQDIFIRGAEIPGPRIHNLDANDPHLQWDQNIRHSQIDDNPAVHRRIFDELIRP
ncbi:MAG: hypothetical protein NZL93_04835, partial [Chthoniobacterales bacterium]|nr:hypothetical protein [Chthoniobacterales bacterium]